MAAAWAIGKNVPVGQLFCNVALKLSHDSSNSQRKRKRNRVKREQGWEEGMKRKGDEWEGLR